MKITTIKNWLCPINIIDAKIICVTVFLMIMTPDSNAQKINYSVANAHSHNDYENKIPFETAYHENFGSIEADVFLWNDSLIVGHTAMDIQYKRTLESLYLDPLNKYTKQNKGYPYKNNKRYLQLLIDIKTEALPTISKLVQVLSKYQILIKSTQIKFVITGNRPAIDTFTAYPAFILFDGDITKNYSASELNKIALFSDDLKNYTKWNGIGNILATDKLKLDSCIKKAHSLHKKIRFWDAPDLPNAWQQIIDLNIDYINTDHIVELSTYLKRKY